MAGLSEVREEQAKKRKAYTLAWSGEPWFTLEDIEARGKLDHLAKSVRPGEGRAEMGTHGIDWGASQRPPFPSASPYAAAPTPGALAGTGPVYSREEATGQNQKPQESSPPSALKWRLLRHWP